MLHDFELASVDHKNGGKSSISDVWQAFKFAFVIIHDF